MSLGGDPGQAHPAVKKFLETPELVEKLLPYLDLASTKHLAESHKLTRKILRNELTWSKLIQRFLPGEEKTNFHVDDPSDDDPLFASEKQKAKTLAEMLTLMKVEGCSGLRPKSK